MSLFTVTSFIMVLQVVPRCHSLRSERINRGDAGGVCVRWDVLQLDGRNVHSPHQPLGLVRTHAGVVGIAACPPGGTVSLRRKHQKYIYVAGGFLGVITWK